MNREKIFMGAYLKMEMIHKNSLEEAIAAVFGNEMQIVSKNPVYGGDINSAFRLTLSDGSLVFMKSNTLKNLSFFEAEAKGLEALRKTETIGVPNVLGLGTDQNISFLLLEYLEAAPETDRYWEVFGRELAELHRADCRHLAENFGFPEDNYIGATIQKNTIMMNWIDFFRECRLLPQMRMADRYFDSGIRKLCTKLLDHLEDYLSEPEFPSLIHGDLWSGNAAPGPDGKAWIFDPAAYVGHYEAELAMTELFGRYPEKFYRAYHEIIHIDSSYQDRRNLYNLYHLLNHLNLFGGSYLSSVKQILSRYV